MTPFGPFQVRVDPWDLDYGDQAPLPGAPDAPAHFVNHEVELPDAQWRALLPPSAATPQRVVFIDGVRRLEARVHARIDGRRVYGAFGSFAAGAVLLRDGEPARFGPLRVFRSAVLGSGEKLPGPVHVRNALAYVAESTADTEPDGPLRHIQGAMRVAEADLARDLGAEGVLTIVDGPLSFEPQRRGAALGYIKRIHEIYLPPRFMPLIAGLPAGARTPLFSIEGPGSGFARYSWFQRLAAPGPGATDLHGLVRLEASAALGVEAVRELADAATAWLPRTAPPRARDPRSPQNLLPIGALEQRLRMELGDARLIRRWIETLVAQQAGVANNDVRPGRAVELVHG